MVELEKGRSEALIERKRSKHTIVHTEMGGVNTTELNLGPTVTPSS